MREKTVAKENRASDGIFIVNYCHPNCVPLKNIMRLPKEEAFAVAKELSEQNPETTAFYRFADFENYYPLRLTVDCLLYEQFVALGGKPEVEHPLSFVLGQSEFLHDWFGGGGTVTRYSLDNISDDAVSFTFGDSCSTYQRTGEITVLTKPMLLERIRESGSFEKFMEHVETSCRYVEVQLWRE